MFSRRFFALTGISTAALAAMARLASSGQSEKAAATTFEVTKTDEEWKKLLTPEQYYVLRKHGTERAGTSPLDKQYGAGTYACAGCELPLFSSATKFDSGTGWPSFYAPLENAVGTTTRPEPVHGAHRGALPALRRPSGPRVRRRAEAHGPALLHERRGAEVHAPRRSRRPEDGAAIAKGTPTMLNLTRAARWLAPLALVAGIATAAAQTTPAPKAESASPSPPSRAAASGAWRRPSRRCRA